MRFEIRNESLGPIPPCTLDFRPLTVLMGGDKAGVGLVLRTVFYLAHLRSLMQMLWERETEDSSSVLEQPQALQNHLATQALMALLVGQNFDLRPGTVLRWGGTEVVLGAPVMIRSLGPEGPSLFFPKERLLAKIVTSPMMRASMGLALEVLHKSQVQLQRSAKPQLRIVELPELVGDPTDQQAETLRLAEWSNLGHQVVFSTHQPLVIATLNNLLQASLLPPREIRGMPLLSQRLGFARVSAYHFEVDIAPSHVFAEGHIQEDPLGRTEKALQEQRERMGLWVRTLREASRQDGSER